MWQQQQQDQPGGEGAHAAELTRHSVAAATAPLHRGSCARAGVAEDGSQLAPAGDSSRPWFVGASAAVDVLGGRYRASCPLRLIRCSPAASPDLLLHDFPGLLCSGH